MCHVSVARVCIDQRGSHPDQIMYFHIDLGDFLAYYHRHLANVDALYLHHYCSLTILLSMRLRLVIFLTA